MYFNSFTYIVFLWSVFVLFWTLRERRVPRQLMLLGASYWFYAQAGWWFTLLLAWTTVIDWWVGLKVGEAQGRGEPRLAKRWLWTSMVSNIALLAVFKYYDFFALNTQAALAHWGVHVSLPVLQLALPVGISFYTFGSMSYVIDVYRGKMPATRSLLDFAVFVAFFAHLVAGPIVRATTLVPQLQRTPEFRLEQVASGLFQILRGMVKKLLMADMLGAHLVDQAFANHETIGRLSGPGILLATYAYALQLYGDFAGYSDIAIGSARLLGYEFPRNFDRPFTASSLEEFWTRWHISMSSWFTDYVYVGMGGSRRGLLRTCWNAFFAWTLVGLWHGAAWTFVLWGMYHGAWLVISRLFRRLLPGGRFPDRWWWKVAGVLFTFHVVAFSMILFRCQNMTSFFAACRALADWSTVGPALAAAGGGLSAVSETLFRGLPPLYWQLGLVMLLGYLTHFMPEEWTLRLEARWTRVPAVAQGLVMAAAIVLLYGLRPPGLTPFVYFQF
jgi:alginate O-acetyltransferase complex protein AlgI